MGATEDHGDRRWLSFIHTGHLCFVSTVKGMGQKDGQEGTGRPREKMPVPGKLDTGIPSHRRIRGAGEAGKLEEPPIKSGRKSSAKRGRMRWRPRGCRKATPEPAVPGGGTPTPATSAPRAAHAPHVHGNAIHAGHDRHSEGEEPSRVTLPDQAPCTLQSRMGWSAQEMRPGGVLCDMLRGLG